MERYELKERAEEDVFFSRRDRELLRRIHEAGEEEARNEMRELVHERCPECGARLAEVEHYGVTVHECPCGHGMWLTEAQQHALAKRERDSWIGRYFYRPRPVV